MANRFTQMFSEAATPPAAGAIPAGFALCPIFFVPVNNVQQVNQLHEIYRQAYEAAQAKARITRLEKRLFSVWN